MWEGLSGGCSTGLTVERCSQLAVFLIQPVGRDAAAVWLVEDGVLQVRASSGLQFGALREHARGRGHYRGEPGCALSGGDEPDLVSVEGNPIFDEPGKC